MSEFADAIVTTLGYLYLLGLLATFINAEWLMLSPPNPVGELKRTWVVIEFDKWVGLYSQPGTKEKGYWDKRAYWFPIPCVGLKYERVKQS